MFRSFQVLAPALGWIRLPQRHPHLRHRRKQLDRSASRQKVKMVLQIPSHGPQKRGDLRETGVLDLFLGYRLVGWSYLAHPQFRMISGPQAYLSQTPMSKRIRSEKCKLKGPNCFLSICHSPCVTTLSLAHFDKLILIVIITCS